METTNNHVNSNSKIINREKMQSKQITCTTEMQTEIKYVKLKCEVNKIIFL